MSLQVPIGELAKGEYREVAGIQGQVKEKKEFLRSHYSQFYVVQAVKEQRKKASKAPCPESDNTVVFCETTIFFSVQDS